MKLEKILEESTQELLLLNESIELDSAKYFWALNELGYKPNFKHVMEIVKTSVQKNVKKDLMVGLVAAESSFRSDVSHYNSGSNDYGLFQLNNLWHNQHRSNISKHIQAGIDHFKWCLKAEKGNEKRALSRYNTGGGDSAAGRRYASYVLGKKSEIDRKANKFKRPQADHRNI